MTLLLSFAVGFRIPQDNIGGLLGGCALLLIAGATFSWMFVWFGLIAGNAQAAQGMSFLAVPLAFVSSGHVPTSTLPDWMQPFAEHQPVTALCNAVRSLMLGDMDTLGIGHTTTYWVVLSLVWCAGIATLLSTLAIIRVYRRR